MKKCTNKKCKQINPQSFENFSINKKSKDGFNFRCKICISEYYSINKSHINKKNSQWYQNNKQECNKTKRKWQRNNKDKVKEYKRKCNNKRRKTDIKFQIQHNLSNRILHAIKGNVKSKRTAELLGCSIEQFISHIEKQFSNKMPNKCTNELMTLRNHGPKGWHIDHIIPCSNFDLFNAIEQQKCFNYTNLQPLWWYDNLEKSDKY